MQPDPTREEIERMRNPTTTEPCAGWKLSRWYEAKDRVLAALEHALSEPDRIAAARAEGYREGVIAERVAMTRIGIPAPFVEMPADGPIRLPLPSAPPAPEPAWTPTHRHWSNREYREVCRVDQEPIIEQIVIYEARNGHRWAAPASVFDGTRLVDDGKERIFAPITEPPMTDRTVSPAQEVEPSAPVAPDLADRLRFTTEEMANRASVPMDLWGLHSNACLDAVARITALEAESAALREDAERWRAFFSSERFSVMGWTGFTLDMQNPQIDPSRDRGLHFGLNVWDRHPGSEEEDAQGTHGRKFLLAYVDHMVRARALLQGQEPAAAGTVGDGR